MQQANYRVHQIKSESEGGKKKNGGGSTEDFPPFGRFLSELCGERGAGNPVSEKKQSGTGDGDGYCQNDNISVSGSFIFASGKKSRLKQQISRNRQHQLADDVRRGEYAGND